MHIRYHVRIYTNKKIPFNSQMDQDGPRWTPGITAVGTKRQVAPSILFSPQVPRCHVEHREFWLGTVSEGEHMAVCQNPWNPL